MQLLTKEVYRSAIAETAEWLSDHLDAAISVETLVICAGSGLALAAATHAAIETSRAFLTIDAGRERPFPIAAIGNGTGAIGVVFDEYAWGLGWHVEAMRGLEEARSVQGPRGQRLVVFREQMALDIPSEVASGGVAYFVRTSGSTGTPKLAGISTGSLDQYEQWFRESFLEASDRLAVLSSFGFDMTINPLIAGVRSGCDLVFPAPGSRRNLRDEVMDLANTGVSFINTTPTLGEALLRAALPGTRLKDLRTMMFGGDRLYAATVERWREFAPNAVQFNCYGVAEATVTSLVHSVDPAADPIPVGFPIPGIEAAVLNDRGELSDGGEGELVLSGPLLGLGYVGPEQGGYRYENGASSQFFTGDRVSIDQGGRVLYLGRNDRRVKIGGGVRVELSEVESRLCEALGIGEGRVAVVGREHDGRVQLCGFYSGARLLDIRLDDVNARLAGLTPLASLRHMDALPLTTNGKTDTRALEQMASEFSWSGSDTSEGAYEAVATAWAKALGTDVLGGRQDWQDVDFFAVGGDSLSLVSLAVELETLGVPSPDLSVLLGNPTAGAHGALLQQAGADRIKGVGRVDPFYPLGSQEASPIDGETAVVVADCVLPGGLDWAAWEACLAEGRSLISDTPKGRPSLATAPPRGLYFSANELETLRAEVGLRVPDEADDQQVLWAYLIGRFGLDRFVRQGLRVGVVVAAGPTFFRGGVGAENSRGLVATTPSFIPGRTSHAHDLSGPCFVLDSACSSGLTVVQTAMDLIAAGRADCMIAGGVQVFQDSLSFDVLREARVLSASDQCRPLDAAADGYLPAEGCAAVVLMRATLARQIGAPVLAVLKGAATNHDGTAVSLTAPRPERQLELIQEVLARAGLTAAGIGFVEAHATGTPLGDPLEMQAIAKTLGGSERKVPLLVSTSKGSIGHSHYAAGTFAFLKAVAQVRSGVCYAAAGLSSLNPRIGSTGAGIDIPNAPRSLLIPVGMVTSFGISGTNCAVVVSASSGLEASGSGGREEEALRDSMMEGEFDVEVAVLRVLAAAAKVDMDSLDRSAHPGALGFDSLELLELADRLRTELGVAIPVDLFISAGSVQHAIEVAEHAMNASGVEEGRREPCQAPAPAGIASNELLLRQLLDAVRGLEAASRQQSRLLTSLLQMPEGASSPNHLAADNPPHDRLAPLRSAFLEATGVALEDLDESAFLVEDLGLSSMQVMQMALTVLPEGSGVEAFDQALRSRTVHDLTEVLRRAVGH